MDDYTYHEATRRLAAWAAGATTDASSRAAMEALAAEAGRRSRTAERALMREAQEAVLAARVEVGR